MRSTLKFGNHVTVHRPIERANTIQPQRNVTLRLRDKLKATLDDLEKKDIITKVEEPVNWVSNLVIVEKANITLRLCLDPPDLDQAIEREDFKPPSFETISNTLNGYKVFSVVDMSNCYWHQKLTDESFCELLIHLWQVSVEKNKIGISCAGEVAQKMVEKHFHDISGALPVFDDIIIGGKSEEEHDLIFRKVLTRARERNIKFNRDKIQFCVNQFKHMDEVVSELGFSPDPEKNSAIHNIPTPACKQDLQRLFGMINYLSKYIPNMSELTTPLWSLLKGDVSWAWFAEHDSALTKINTVLSCAPVLQFYDTSLPTTLQVDASKDGLGACLMQQGQPVAYTSRALSNSEINYAPIENEVLTIVLGVRDLICILMELKWIRIISLSKLPLKSLYLKFLFAYKEWGCVWRSIN